MTRLLLVAVLVLVSGSCGGSGTRKLTALDSGTRVAIATGDVVEVSLTSNQSTGYHWDTVAVPAVLTLNSDEYVEPDANLVGASGTRVITFDALAKGAGILRLEYVRPFDDPPVPARVAEYVIIVDGAAWPPESVASPPAIPGATSP